MDLLNLTPKELLSLDGFAKKKADKLYSNIQKIVGNTSIDKIIVLLQSKDLGTSIAQQLANESGISDEVFKNYVKLLRKKDEYVQEIINAIQPIQKVLETVEQVSNLLEGKNICITGTLDRPRAEYIKIIEANGGHFVKSVNKKTDILCIGKDVGNVKIDKAKKLGVKVEEAKDLFKNL